MSSLPTDCHCCYCCYCCTLFYSCWGLTFNTCTTRVHTCSHFLLLFTYWCMFTCMFTCMCVRECTLVRKIHLKCLLKMHFIHFGAKSEESSTSHNRCNRRDGWLVLCERSFGNEAALIFAISHLVFFCAIDFLWTNDCRVSEYVRKAFM